MRCHTLLLLPIVYVLKYCCTYCITCIGGSRGHALSSSVQWERCQSPIVTGLIGLKRREKINCIDQLVSVEMLKVNSYTSNTHQSLAASKAQLAVKTKNNYLNYLGFCAGSVSLL